MEPTIIGAQCQQSYSCDTQTVTALTTKTKMSYNQLYLQVSSSCVEEKCFLYAVTIALLKYLGIGVSTNPCIELFQRHQ
jgi:hypothetical protein